MLLPTLRVAGFVLGMCLLFGATAPAQADKVGVAAAVNPDAFSSLSETPTKQLNIGKSIFYDERINTSGSGLVQVLLIDGSTFTVGPNSDLVIDKFVYDPNKKTGQVVATFSKGTMRFIGGKLSKNDGGVTVKTPAGALAIRGGMFQAQVNGPKIKASFLYGVSLSFLGNNGVRKDVFEQGYTLDLTSGTPVVRLTTSEDTQLFAKAFSGGGTVVVGGQPPAPNENQTAFETVSLQDLISDATATQIQDEIQSQINKLTNPPDHQPTPPSGPQTEGPETPETPETPPQETSTASFGYAGGVFRQNGHPNDPPVGTLTNLSPTEVGVLFGDTTGAFKGAVFNLFVDRGKSDAGGAKLTFLPTEMIPVGQVPLELPEDLQGVFLGIGGAGIPNSIVIYEETTGDPPQLGSPATLDSGAALLVGFNDGEELCTDCSFLKFGAWALVADFRGNEEEEQANHVETIGWWIAGDLPTVGQLPTQGIATYEGTAIGMVSLRKDRMWQTPYPAEGKLNMVWSFNERAGLLAITDFDKHGERGPLNVAGLMRIPGQLASTDVNKFSGGLVGTVGKGFSVLNPKNWVTGAAVGSFAANGTDASAGIIGNWNAAAKDYQASGIFGGSRTNFYPNSDTVVANPNANARFTPGAVGPTGPLGAGR